MEATTELATAHSIIGGYYRTGHCSLNHSTLGTPSPCLLGSFYMFGINWPVSLSEVRVFRCPMFLLHGVRTSVRARSTAYPAGYWIRDHHHLYSNQIHFDTYDIYYSRRSCICATPPTPPPPLPQSNLPVHARALYIPRVSTGLLV